MLIETLKCNNVKDNLKYSKVIHTPGFKYMFEEKLVTIWSAPNYCYRCGNVAAVIEFKEPDVREAKLFKAVPDNERVIPSRTTTPYFL